MNTTDAPVRLSILDRAVIRRGEDAAQTLRRTVRSAQQAEELGYHRFWVAEHHSVPGIAGSAPTVLAAGIAAATSRIRVGTGGVMLPNHRPLVVAEQFGVLEALHSGRIDMGLGRSVGFTPGIRAALGHDLTEADHFGEQLSELLGYFTGDQTTHPGVHARPGQGLRPQPFILAIGSGGDLAATHGLPLVIAPARGEAAMHEAIEKYRVNFRPSVWADSPYVVLALTVAAAATAAEAERMLLPEAWSTALSRTRGDFEPLWPSDEVAAAAKTEREERYLRKSLAGAVSGTAEQVGATLRGLVERAGAQEILVSNSTYDEEELLDSRRRLAELFTA